MSIVNVKEARRTLGKLVDSAAGGETVEITRRGRKVARIVACEPKTGRKLPDLTAFRASIHVKGAALSSTVISQRREARY
jgi:prevent-host-death family protein